MDIFCCVYKRSFACAQDDIVRELVILNGAKRSEVSHNMPAGAVY